MSSVLPDKAWSKVKMSGTRCLSWMQTKMFARFEQAVNVIRGVVLRAQLRGRAEALDRAHRAVGRAAEGAFAGTGPEEAGGANGRPKCGTPGPGHLERGSAPRAQKRGDNC